MFFRKGRGATFLVVWMIVLLLGCKWEPGRNLSVGEKNPPTPPLQVNLGRFACLSDIDNQVSAYLESELEDKDVEDLAECLQGAIRQFEFLTRDSKSSAYTPTSLAEFLNREYLSKNKLSKSFVNEIMAAKVLMLGGSIDVITREELSASISLIDTLRDEAIDNLPYIKIYRRGDTLDAKDLTNAQLEAAQAQLRRTGEVFAKIFAAKEQTYTLAAMGRLLTQARIFLKWDTRHPESMSVDKIMSLVQVTKDLLLGKRSGVFVASEWENLFDTYSTLYGFYLNYHLKIKNHKLTYGPALESLVTNVNRGFELVAKIIDHLPNKKMSFLAIDSVLSAVSDAGFMYKDIKVESLQPVYRGLFSRGLRNPKKVSEGTARTAHDLGLEEWQELKSEFDLWSRVQLFLSHSSRDGLNLVFDRNLGAKEPAIHIISQFDFMGLMSSLRIQDKQLSAEMQFLKKNFMPMFKADDARVHVMPSNEYAPAGFKYDIATLSRLNLVRTIVRLVIRTFAADSRVLAFEGLSEREVADFYSTIRSLGIDLRIADPRKLTGGASYYREASIFTFSGDGVTPVEQPDQLVTFRELSELVFLMWSGGAMRDIFYQKTMERCLADGVKEGPKDPLGMAKIQRTCFMQHFADDHFKEFSNLPHMQKALAALRSQPETYARTIQNLERIAFIPCEDPQYIEEAEMAAMVTVIHYMEVIFSIYDVDRNNLLNAHEAMRAFHRFHGFLDRTIFDLKQKRYEVDMLKSIYLYIMQKLEMPSSLGDYAKILWNSRKFNADPNEFRRSLAEIQNKELPEAKMDRLQMLQLLRVLAESSKSSYNNVSCQR